MKSFILMGLTLFVASGFAACDSSDDPDKPASCSEGSWSETISGADEIIGAYPDLYSNYWEYTWSVADNPGTIIKLNGQFPHCRYCSFSLYDDETGSAIGGIDDVNIIPDPGSQNPFVRTVSGINTFTVYLVPAGVSQSVIDDLGSANICRIESGVKKAVVMLRHYLGTDGAGGYDEFGGVSMPTISAISADGLKPVDAPAHLRSNVYDATSQVYVQKSDEYQEMPFFLAPVSKYYPNNSTAYLYARTHLHQDEVLTFSFIPAPVPTCAEENLEAPARYWSMCLGSAADTRSYVSTCDRDARWSLGQKAAFVVALASNPRLQEINADVERRNRAGEYVNLLIWDSNKVNIDGKPIGETIAFMYRNILPDASWTHSIANMLPTAYMDETGEPIDHVTDPSKQIADIALGDYGPRGIKMPTADYLAH